MKIEHEVSARTVAKATAVAMLTRLAIRLTFLAVIAIAVAAVYFATAP